MCGPSAWVIRLGAVRCDLAMVGLVVGWPAAPGRRKFGDLPASMRSAVGLVGFLAGGRDIRRRGGPVGLVQRCRRRLARGVLAALHCSRHAGRLPSRVRRAICRDAMESNAKERRSAPGYPLVYRNCRESLLHIEVHRHDSGNLADFITELCRNSLARKRPGVRISSAPRE
jgi:hypothetical protein